MVDSSGGEVICERAMYGNDRAWGTDSIGAITTDPPPGTWRRAAPPADFETWVLVQNPNADPVTVDLTFMTSAGPQDGPQDAIVEAYSRRSFNAGDYVTDYDVSTVVDSSGGGVVCERAMYGNGRAWAHDSVGVTTARRPPGTWRRAAPPAASRPGCWCRTLMTKRPSPWT